MTLEQELKCAVAERECPWAIVHAESLRGTIAAKVQRPGPVVISEIAARVMNSEIARETRGCKRHVRTRNAKL
jgi:hypothetical protein